MKALEKKKDEIQNLLLFGIQNPIIASALYLQSSDFILAMFYILNSTAFSKQFDHESDISDKIVEVAKLIQKNLKLQTSNIQRLLQSPDQAASSIVDDLLPISSFEDIQPFYQSELTIFEDEHASSGKDREMVDFINRNCKICSEDQFFIVLRKVQFYLESLSLFIKF